MNKQLLEYESTKKQIEAEFVDNLRKRFGNNENLIIAFSNIQPKIQEIMFQLGQVVGFENVPDILRAYADLNEKVLKFYLKIKAEVEGEINHDS